MPRWDLMVIPCQIYGRNHVKGGFEQIIGRPAKVKKVEVDLMTSDFLGEFFEEKGIRDKRNSLLLGG